MKKMFLLVTCAILSRCTLIMSMDGAASNESMTLRIPAAEAAQLNYKQTTDENMLKLALSNALKDVNKLPDEQKLPKLATAYLVCDQLQEMTQDELAQKRADKKKIGLLQRAYCASKSLKFQKDNKVDLSKIDAETKAKLTEIFGGIVTDKLYPQIAIASYAFFRHQHINQESNKKTLEILASDYETRSKEKELLDNQVVEMLGKVDALKLEAGKKFEDMLKLESKSNYLKQASEILLKQRENSYTQLKEQQDQHKQEASTLAEDIKKLEASIVDLKKQVNTHDDVLKIRAEIKTKQARINKLQELQINAAAEIKKMENKLHPKTTVEYLSSYLPSMPSIPSMPSFSSLFRYSSEEQPKEKQEKDANPKPEPATAEQPK